MQSLKNTDRRLLLDVLNGVQLTVAVSKNYQREFRDEGGFFSIVSLFASLENCFSDVHNNERSRELEKLFTSGFAVLIAAVRGNAENRSFLEHKVGVDCIIDTIFMSNILQDRAALGLGCLFALALEDINAVTAFSDLCPLKNFKTTTGAALSLSIKNHVCVYGALNILQKTFGHKLYVFALEGLLELARESQHNLVCMNGCLDVLVSWLFDRSSWIYTVSSEESEIKELVNLCREISMRLIELGCTSDDQLWMIFSKFKEFISKESADGELYVELLKLIYHGLHGSRTPSYVEIDTRTVPETFLMFEVRCYMSNQCLGHQSKVSSE